MWRAANPERAAAYDKAWYEANRERQAAHYAANKGRYAANDKAWRIAHPEAAQALAAKRRARKRNAEGSYTAADTKRLRAEQGDRCAHCKAALRGKGHVDHVQPLSKGGSNWPDNLQLLCGPCNLSKHAKDPVQHIAARGIVAPEEAAFLVTLPLAERIAFVKALAL
jgi:5-methylcytosine-specific restriction endonuclease McrA